jgi:hypothetical protein
LHHETDWGFAAAKAGIKLKRLLGTLGWAEWFYGTKTTARPNDGATRMRRYSRSSAKDVRGAMRKRKRGTLKSGSGRKVKSRKQAIAIGLAEARRKGKKVPKRGKS